MHRIRIIIPIRGPEEDESLYKNYKYLLKHLEELTSDKDFIHLIDDREERYKQIIEIAFKTIHSSKYFKHEDAEIKNLSERYKFFHSEWISDFLEINLTFKRNLKDFTAITVNYILKRLSLLAHLAYNMKLDFLPGVIFNTTNIKRAIGKTEILISDIEMAYMHAKKTKWPIIKQPKIHRTIKWFISNAIHPDDLSKSRVQKSINAFSYNFFHLHEKETSELLWNMIGIESLLAEGSNNIISQIKTKLTLILGEPKEFKKKLDKLYNYRSRFVHGDIEFPAKFSSDYENFEREYWDYSKFALSILIALIKRLIFANKTEFEFEYKLKK